MSGNTTLKVRNVLRMIIALLLVVVAGQAIFQASPARAVRSDSYTWTYSNTNFYGGYSLQYWMYNVTPEETYVWFIEQTDVQGNTIAPIKSVTLVVPAGITQTQVTMFTAQESYELNRTAYIRVKDDIGRTLGRHIVMPRIGTSHFYESFAGCLDSSFAKRTVIVPFTHTFAPFDSCASGTQYHNPDVRQTMVRDGAPLFLHYGLADYFLTLTDSVVEIKSLDTTTVVATIAIEDIECYQGAHYYGDEYVVEGFPNFILITTNSDTVSTVAVIDYALADFCFTTYDNPMRLNLAVGAYEYAFVDDYSGFFDDTRGESTFVVTSSENPPWYDTKSRSTTGISVKSGIQTSRLMQYDVSFTDQGIWAGYNTTFALSDTTQGIIQDMSAAFVNRARSSYTVSASAGNRTLQFKASPTTTYTGVPTDNFDYIMEGDYTTVVVPNAITIVRDELSAAGWLAPTQSVILFVLLNLIINAILFGVLHSVSLTMSTAAYAFIGIVFVFMSVWSILIITFWVLGLILLAWMSFQGVGAEA